MKDFLVNYPPVAAAIYAMLGLVIFLISFWLIEKLTPGQLWEKIIEEGNVAAALVVGCSLLGISAIIAVAIVS